MSIYRQSALRLKQKAPDTRAMTPALWRWLAKQVLFNS